MAGIFADSPKIYLATLANWSPKCNQEMETRVRLNFEVPLSEEVIADLPEPLQKVARAVAKLDDGLTEGTISNDYEQSLEIYETGSSGEALLRLESATLTGMHIFRPVPKDGPSNELFLCFKTTVRAEGLFGAQLVTWALPHLRRTIFFRAYERQGRLPLEVAA